MGAGAADATAAGTCDTVTVGAAGVVGAVGVFDEVQPAANIATHAKTSRRTMHRENFI
jgi:hypothetical protein